MYFLKGPTPSEMPQVAARRHIPLPPVGEKRLSNVALAQAFFQEDNDGRAPLGVYLPPDIADFINGRGYGNIAGVTVPYFLCYTGPIRPSGRMSPGTYYSFEAYDGRTPV